MPRTRRPRRRRRGAVLVLSMLFVLILSALAMSLAGLSGSNVQLASNQHLANTALYAAQSGLECARYFVNTVGLGETYSNFVTDAQANQAWTDLCQHIQAQALDGKTVPSASRFTDASGAGDELVTQPLGLGNANVDFILRFYRYDNDASAIKMQSLGISGSITRRVDVEMAVAKDAGVLEYAIASRGRMWLTGDTAIHGDIYSSWDRAEISPFNMTGDSRVEGTINTVLELNDIMAEGYQMETVDAEGLPFDINGDPLGENYAERYYKDDDEIQAYHEGINYGQPEGTEVPGMNISDYNTDDYTTGLTTIPACSDNNRITEYFPHAAGDYTEKKYDAAHTYERHVYQNQTFTNATLPTNRHALFVNCTFEEVLYVDCYKNNYGLQTQSNNVRFQDCTFNGVIVTDVPKKMDWMDNCLYFTGSATFNNQSSVPEATILAPHFNVNLGNTNPNQGDQNVLTGAVVGGIVDIRGNAEINGTIISMYDATSRDKGYVTNIGATLDDGGTETSEAGDIGTISITPQKDMMLPSGISSPLIIKTDNSTYSESA